MRRLFYGIVLVLLIAAAAGCGRPGDRDFRRGIRELHRDRPVRARAHLESTLKRRPGHINNADVLNAIGVACVRMNDEAAAIRAFEESRRMDPRGMAAVCNLAILYARRGEWAAASALFEEAALLQPERTEALEHAAGMYAKIGRPGDAERVLEEARARDPTSPRILNALAAIQILRHQPDPAERLLAHAMELDPGNLYTLHNYAVLYAVHRDRRDQAGDYVRRFQKQAPTHPRLAPWIELTSRPAPRAQPPPRIPVSETAQPAPAMGPLDRARDLGRRGRVREALALCLETAEEARRNRRTAEEERALQTAVEVAPDQADAHLAYARFLEEQNRLEAAFRMARQASLLAPQSIEPLRVTARIATRREDFDLALLVLRQAAQIRPDFADVRWELALLLDETLGLPNEAAEQYRIFIRSFPNDPRLHTARQRVAALAPEAQPAPRSAPPQPTPQVPVAAQPQPERPAPAARPDRRVEWQRGGRRNPGAAERSFQRGLQQQRQGDAEGALRFFLRALENDPRNATPLYSIADIYRLRGDLDLAQDAFRQALEIGPDRPQARYNLAVILHARGRNDTALEELRRALEMDPSFSPAWYLSGLIHAGSAGRTAAARRAFTRFLETAPDDPLAGPVREWLRANP